MGSDKQTEETSVDTTPTNGGAQASAEAAEPSPPKPKRKKVALDPSLKWLEPIFGMPVTVQTVDPIWQVRCKEAMLVQLPDENGKPQTGTLGLPELARDEKGEAAATDVFEGVELQPCNDGQHVVILQNAAGGQALYMLSPQQIRCVAQVAPSEEQVQNEIARARARNIVVPGAPGNQGGKIIV